MTRFPEYPGRIEQDATSRDLQKAMNFHRRNELDKASPVYRRILKINPEHPDALQYLAALCIQSGNLPEADIFYKRAIQANAPSSILHANYGSVLHQLSRYEEAVAHYDTALAINPDDAEALYNRGNSLHAMARFDDAIISYQNALSLNPAHADAYYNLGNALQAWKRFDDAIATYDKVALLEPSFALAYLNRGNALRELRFYGDAIASYDKAISVKHDFTDAFSNRGGVLKDLKRFDEALSSYLSALSIDPKDAEVYWNISLTLLLLGNFKDGLEFYEWRKKIKRTLGNRPFPKPLWLGQESLSRKRILIHEEQGIGDIIQFCRYLTHLEDRGAEVIFAVAPRLHGLAASLGGRIEIRSIENVSLDFDFHCPLMSLPRAFNTDLTSIPSTTPYLFANGEQVTALRRDLLQKGARKICGLSWRSSNSSTGRSRSVSLPDLFDHVDPRDFLFVNLQYGDVSQEIADLRDQRGVEVISIPAIDNFNDIDGFAALVDACDLIVTIDNTTAHLAGAMNKKTFVMLPYVPDWRWMLDRNDSPWYPSMRLFRQPSHGDWNSVFKKIRKALLDDIQ